MRPPPCRCSTARVCRWRSSSPSASWTCASSCTRWGCGLFEVVQGHLGLIREAGWHSLCLVNVCAATCACTLLCALPSVAQYGRSRASRCGSICTCTWLLLAAKPCQQLQFINCSWLLLLLLPAGLQGAGVQGVRDAREVELAVPVAVAAQHHAHRPRVRGRPQQVGVCDFVCDESLVFGLTLDVVCTGWCCIMAACRLCMSCGAHGKAQHTIVAVCFLNLCV